MKEEFMKRALELAEKARGNTNPNPMVGAVIVKDGRIIGEGYHKIYGGPHAEIEAFLQADEDVEGSDLYVTLEPCAHYGKTPPCVEAIVLKKIKRVYVAVLDPNPLVSGKGIQILRDAGIEVEIGLLKDSAKALNEIFFQYITTKRPYVIMKSAMTLDGKIATFTGASRWITGSAARTHVHEWRRRVGAIMVGIGTVLKDNPKLNVRLSQNIRRHPMRIVVDSKGRLPQDALILNNLENEPLMVATTENITDEKKTLLESMGAEVVICPEKEGRVDLSYLMHELGKRKVDSVLLEGGGILNYAFLEEGLVDKVLVYIAPIIFGGKDASTPVEGKGVANPHEAFKLEIVDIHHFDDDILIEAQMKKRSDQHVYRID